MNRVLVVGASSGIGAATAKLLAREAQVFALARRSERLEELGKNVVSIPFDVTRLNEIDGLLKTLTKEHGRFLSLVYCAGVQLIKPVKLLVPEELETIFKVNFYAPLFFARAFAARSVHEKENPSIVFVSSIASLKPEKGVLPYSASKAALENLSRGLALEIAPIRVNCVAPGFLKTEMTNQFSKIYNDAFIEKIASEYPLGLGSPEKVANLIRFLISKEADYITGESIRIDGGGAL